MLTLTFAYRGRHSERHFEIEVDSENVDQLWEFVNYKRLELSTFAPLGSVVLLDGEAWDDLKDLVPCSILTALRDGSDNALNMLDTFMAADCDADVYRAYVKTMGDYWSEESAEDLAERYRGEWPNWEDFAHDTLMETDEIYAKIHNSRSSLGYRTELDEIAWHQDYSFVNHKGFVYVFDTSY